MTSRVKKLVERLMRGAEWTDAGQGWQGAEAPLRLTGWSCARRAVVLRRRIDKDLAVVDQSDPEQLRLSFAELTDEAIVYEYAVPVTSLRDEILTVARLYRDRADCENPFDESWRRDFSVPPKTVAHRVVSVEFQVDRPDWITVGYRLTTLDA
jgi:hypothetical protein